MQIINLDSENSLFDAVNKTYGTMDYLVKFLNDNGSNINVLPVPVSFDNTLNISKENYAVSVSKIDNPNKYYSKSENQTEFDIILNVCADLNNLAKILNENNANLNSDSVNFTIQRVYISDIKISNHLLNNNKRFNTGYSLQQNSSNSYLLQEDGHYLLQEDLNKILI